MAKAKKFGALSGVFTPSLLTILGVIMYLRLPWIVGQAGLWATIGIIVVAHIISFTTGLSVASIATDKKVETGGSYYIISRSLGLPIGGTLGLALFAGLSFSISLYLIGFAEVFLGYFGFEVTINNIRIAGSIALLLLTVLTFISTSLAIKAQYIILTALALSLVSIFFGQGNQGPSEPLFASMSGSLPWITLFAIFFPAVTGFEAGVSMSGDLKDPRKNIPAGTIAAVLVGLVIYLGLAFFFSYMVDRDLLVNDSSVLFNISLVPQLVLAGMLGATLSSALGSILGAPRILQATAIDRITPARLGKGYGASNEPRNALLFTFVIALAGILIGELNVIARIVTIFFIITYGFLNITYAIESWAGTDFRPSFRIPGFISIIGAVTCIVVMIQLDIVALIGASLVLMGLFLFLKNKELTLQTGDTWNSVWASIVKTGLGKLTLGNKEPRNWRPNIILFSGGAKHRPYLINVAKALVGKLGIFTNFELVENKDEKTLFSKEQQIIEEEATERKGVFTRKHVCRDVYEGMESIAKIYGFSGFEPNTILMGWPRNSRKPEAFVNMVKKFKKLDYSQIFLNYDKTFDFGKKRRIDLWWSGKGRNISFALTLLRFISSSQSWRTAQIRILVINNQSSLTEKYYELLEQILENKRIKAEIKIINNSVEKQPATNIMRSESIETDLSIIELDDKQEDFFEKINLLTESLPSSLILSASTFFDEHTVVSRPLDERITEPEETQKPTFNITPSLSLAEREIIANEVFKTAQNLENITADFFKNGFESLLDNSLDYHQNLLQLAEKTSDQLYTACQTEDPDLIRTEFLKILNDFSFRAQSTLKNFRQEVIVSQKQDLQSSSLRYFKLLEKNVQELPQHIRIKYNWKEYRLLKADSFVTGVFKIGKLIKARITGKPATYRIKVHRAAAYYLYHKRLKITEQLYLDFALQSFGNIITIRNLLSGIYELAEKGKIPSFDRVKFKTIIQMEKDRFKAALSLASDNYLNFTNNLGKTMEVELLNDLQDFNNILMRPGSNFTSKPFEKICSKDPELLEGIKEFPQIWQTNANLFINKIYLDFLLQSLKNRLEAKIRKYNTDFTNQLTASLLKPTRQLQAMLEEFSSNGVLAKKPDKTLFKIPSLEEHYSRLFEEITALFSELPIVLSIAGDDLSKNLEEKRFEEAHEIIVSVRKTVEFSIASELIDLIKKQNLEASISYEKSLAKIKDYIRLINFNLYDEADTDLQDQKEKHKLAQDFTEKLKTEEKVIGKIMPTLEDSFAQGLKNTFAPLSSAVIAKTSGNISKRIQESRNRKLYGQMSSWQKGMAKNIQQQFVKLIYTKSESILWMGKMEKPGNISSFSNEEVYSWLDNYSPKQEIVNQLPFYYSKLFSGQSGIGEDFWVGMKEEISQAEKAIERFRSGQPGCIIISGPRNSGKTSLSKHIARSHFAAENIFNIRAPRECTADVSLFESTMLKTLNAHHHSIEGALQELNSPAVFIINDLELWWERKTHGTQVVEKLLSLVKNYHQKALFIINVNIFSLRLIHKLTAIQSWATVTINCSGFDARELHDMIMLRHQAGGMSFVVDKKEESDMSAWNFANLFNRYFDLSGGNPGLAINLWLASIKKVSGKTIYMQKPKAQKPEFLDKLTREQVFYLLQFIYHLRLGVDKLAETLQSDRETLNNQILNLWQSGLLVEKFPGIYAINPALQQPLAYKLKEMKLL
ncbi:MAG: AAA family ATPase [Bacteroidetes bacterium]|nr:MAG: AAA family ATPase [Bacteroidota bacterium]